MIPLTENQARAYSGGDLVCVVVRHFAKLLFKGKPPMQGMKVLGAEPAPRVCALQERSVWVPGYPPRALDRETSQRFSFSAYGRSDGNQMSERSQKPKEVETRPGRDTVRKICARQRIQETSRGYFGPRANNRSFCGPWQRTVASGCYIADLSCGKRRIGASRGIRWLSCAVLGFTIRVEG